jgi:Rad3-related DNA helicase
MSATIGGDGSTLAEALGLGEFAFRNVPHRWPPEDRPIWIPEDAPRLGGKAKPADYEHQADLLAKGLRTCPPEWSGLILTTSKAEARRVAGRLAERGFGDRVWVTPEKHRGRWAGTQLHTQLWGEEKRKRDGALCVTWNFWRGFDGLDEKIVAVMKAPFAPRGEPGSYQAEKVRAEGAMYHWRTANKLAQGVGRTRRGRDEDYGPGSGFVAVLDGNYRMVKKHLPVDFAEAVRQEL